MAHLVRLNESQNPIQVSLGIITIPKEGSGENKYFCCSAYDRGTQITWEQKLIPPEGVPDSLIQSLGYQVVDDILASVVSHEAVAASGGNLNNGRMHMKGARVGEFQICQGVVGADVVKFIDIFVAGLRNSQPMASQSTIPVSASMRA